MAHEIANSFAAGVRWSPTTPPNLREGSVNVASVIRNGVGDWTVNLVDGIGNAESLCQLAADDSGVDAESVLTYRRISDTAWTVNGWDGSGNAKDPGGRVSFNLFRVVAAE